MSQLRIPRWRLHAVLVPALAVLAACSPTSSMEEIPGGGISAENLARHLSILASDEFEGRAPATRGEELTVAYISEQFAAAGLQPAGDHGTWTQAVTLERSEIIGPVTASLRTGGQVRTLENGEEIAVETLYPTDKVALDNVPLVFVGYGIDAPELGWNDYEGVDVAGKIAVMLVNDPDFETAPGKFDGPAMTLYGRWTYKYEEAARKGALGALIIHETAPAAYPWQTVRNGRLSPQYDIVREDAENYHLELRGWIQRDLAVDMFAAAGLEFETAKRGAQQQGFRGYPLEDAQFSAAFEVARERIVSYNVAGVLQGTERPEETIILSGHWDSFGITATPDARGDAIINGAVDNATSIASLIEIARVFTAGERPARSLLFLATTSEESGLLGAMYYAAHPLRPLETTVAVLNIEMWSPDGETRDISSWGIGKVSLERDLKAIAEREGRTYSTDQNLEAGLFFRADHFAFAKAGVPAITIGPGMDQLEGGVEGGLAARADYFTHRYHQPGDEFDDTWDMTGPTTDTRTVYRLAADLAGRSDWPQWDADSAFHAIREKSAQAREIVK